MIRRVFCFDMLLENALKNILLTESVSVKEVEDAINKHNRIIINYHSKGEDKNTGARVVEVYAYGLTKAGNPVVRCFQPYGDTTSRVPSWKFFRLDRISEWKPTKQIFNHPADFYYKNLGKFNEEGDETMSVVYKIADFKNDDNEEQTINQSRPKTKDEVYKTDTERKLERLKQQLENPINISDLKTNDAFGKQNNTSTETETTSGPKTKDDVYKTDTERGMERLQQQLKNPKMIDLSQFDKYDRRKQKNKPQNNDNDKDVEKLRDALKDGPVSLSDLKTKINEPEKTEEPKKTEPFKTDTERGMDRLQQQLKNPRMIDLTKIPRR